MANIKAGTLKGTLASSDALTGKVDYGVVEIPAGFKKLYMRVAEEHIQISMDAETWENVVPMSELKGEKGDAGSNGSDGIDGIDGTSVDVATEQLDDGVRITLTSKEGSKTFDIFNGKDGADGLAGKDGKDGYTPQKGIDYFDGKDGATGPEGPQGIQGPKGDKGETGETGATGPKGDKGDKGETGSAGKDGKDGTSCTHSWNGTTLTVTSASGTSSANLKGEKGDKGDTGSQGPKGDKGDKGDTGATGPQGPKGDKGDTGATGPTGPQGPAGADGKNGTDATVTADKVKSVLGYTPAKQTKVDQLSEEIANYLPKNQGSANVGKILMVGTDGNLVLTDMPESGVSGDVVGVIDESNNILLSGNIADGTYTLAFENEDGTYTGSGSLVVSKVLKLVSISASKTKKTYTVGDTLNTNDITVTATYDDGSTATITDYTVNSSAVQMGTAGNYNLTISYGGKITTVAITVEAVPEPTYTNLADTTSADWKTGYRLDGSGALKQDSSITNLATTNFIACKNGDVIRIKGLTLGGTGQRVAVYTSNKGNYSAIVPSFPHNDSVISAEVESTGVYKFTLKYANTAYIRFSGVLTGTSANVIITKNEAIS